jgi:hypothetical protein
LAEVPYWHKADILKPPINVHFRGKADIAHVIEERQLRFSPSPETRCLQLRMALIDPAAVKV